MKAFPIIGIFVLPALLLLSACQTPLLTFPGKRLQGVATTTGSFGFAEDYALLKLEVNPLAPYSVILRCTVLDGELYVDAAPLRKWAGYLESDRRVRVMLGSSIYDAVAEKVAAPEITTRFPRGRTIYRLVPEKAAKVPASP